MFVNARDRRQPLLTRPEILRLKNLLVKAEPQSKSDAILLRKIMQAEFAHYENPPRPRKE